MTEDRIKKLEAVDRWVWSPRGLEWDVRLSELQKYKAEHGDCLVPRNYSATPQLGAWVCLIQCLVELTQKNVLDLKSYCNL